MRRLPAIVTAGALALSIGACTAQRVPDVKMDTGVPMYTTAPAVPGQGAGHVNNEDNCLQEPIWPVHHAQCGMVDDSTLAPAPPAPKPKKAKTPKATAHPSHHKAKASPSATAEVDGSAAETEDGAQ